MSSQLSAGKGGCLWLDALQAPRTRFLVTNAALLLALKFSLNGSLFSTLCVLIGWGHVYPHQLLKVSQSVERFCQKRHWSPVGAMLFVLASTVAFIGLFGHVEPASAQFFAGTEKWLSSNLGKGSSGTNVADMIALTFNVLRALFVIYLGISLVKVVQNARDGEDWQTLAKTPLIILVTVTLGDVLGNMITGGGSGGTAAAK